MTFTLIIKCSKVIEVVNFKL